MNLAEFITSIRGYSGYKNPATHPDSLISSWIRMGEERIELTLRIDEMVQIDTATIYNNKAGVPLDWIAHDFLAYDNGTEVKYLARADFYSRGKPTGYYTMAGRIIMVGGKIDQNEGLGLELHYFGRVPKLLDAANWLSDKHVRLLTAATMVPTSMHLQEPERATLWDAETTRFIDELNLAYQTSTAKSGTIVKRHRRVI